MALDAAGVAGVSLEDILFNDVQEFLVQEAVVAGTIMDLTSRIKKGDQSVKVPRVTGLAVSDVKQDNTEAVSSNMGLTSDVMPLSSFKEVPDYIFEGGDLESTVDIKAAFLDAAPRVLADFIDADLITELKNASAAAPDHIQQLSEGVLNTRPSLADIQNAGLLLTKQNVPKTERFLLVSPEIKVHLMAKTEIQDASKAGSNTALVNGEFARLFGFIMLESNNLAAAEMIAYHTTAAAWGMQKTVEFIEEQQRSKGREFVSMRTKYGKKTLDAGVRQVFYNATGA